MVTIVQEYTEKQIACEKPQSILEFLRESGYELTAVCSGNQTCGKCKVRVLEGAPPVNKREEAIFSDDEIREGYRLSCAHPISSGMKIKLEINQKARTLTAFQPLKGFSKSIRSRTGFGIAIDLGTTTVVAALVSFESGEIVQIASFLNPQRSYGADVISRIDAAKQVGVGVMKNLIREKLVEEIEGLCALEKVSLSEIEDIVVSGNTTMLYLLQGYDPKELAVAPFTVSHGECAEYGASDFFSSEWSGRVHLFPCISAYVGGDIVSGIYAYEKELADRQPACMLDLGTNGEIVLMDRGSLVCAATAAGPAFEGAKIQWGMGGVSGAISTFKIIEEKSVFSTIDNAKPLGICGSGIVDVVAEGLRVGKIDKTGRMSSGEMVLCEAPNHIGFTQKDVREVQLAKAAIAAGIQVLAKRAEISQDGLKGLFIAGGFGQYMNLLQAGRIGLIPQAAVKNGKTLGNASLAGAVKALFDKKRVEHLEAIRSKCTYVELSSDHLFNTFYIKEMGF